jgi:hypothetical protein
VFGENEDEDSDFSDDDDPTPLNEKLNITNSNITAPDSYKEGNDMLKMG